MTSKNVFPGGGRVLGCQGDVVHAGAVSILKAGFPRAFRAERVRVDSKRCYTPVRTYLVSFENDFDNEPPIEVRYCLHCASAAAANDLGNVTSIEVCREVMMEVAGWPDGWRLWDDGQIESNRGGGSWQAPFKGETVDFEILDLAGEAGLKLWGWRDKGESNTSEVVPFWNLGAAHNCIWYREEDCHTYWRTHDGWMAAPTFTNGNPDWDNAQYVEEWAEELCNGDLPMTEEEFNQLLEWLKEKP